jgi:hypothetical protein
MKFTMTSISEQYTLNIKNLRFTFSEQLVYNSCIIFWDLSVKNVRVKSYVYIYMHSALTGVQVLVTRTPEQPIDWLIIAGVYKLWLQRKGKRYKYYIQMLVHWFLFCLGFIFWQQGTCFIFDYDTKETEHQNTK